MTQHRDGNGRFTPGNPGGPGRKPRQTEQAYLQAMESIVDEEAWQAIVQKATQDAIGGDAKARAWLSSYLLGTPTPHTENDMDAGMEAFYRIMNDETL